MYSLDAMTHCYVTLEQFNVMIHEDVIGERFKCQHRLTSCCTSCCTGLRLIHEMTAQKGRQNVVRLDARAADGTNGFDAFNSFFIDAAPGYTPHIGTRNSSLNLREYVSISIECIVKEKIQS